MEADKFLIIYIYIDRYKTVLTWDLDYTLAQLKRLSGYKGYTKHHLLFKTLIIRDHDNGKPRKAFRTHQFFSLLASNYKKNPIRSNKN